MFNLYRLKCNRELPCDSCIKRNKSASCQYAANATRSRHTPTKTRDLSDRLESLAQTVSIFLDHNATIPAPPPQSQRRGSSGVDADKTVLTPELPHVQETEDGQVNYIDRGHWLSILNDIKEVREHLDTDVLSSTSSQTKADDTSPPKLVDGTHLLNLNSNSDSTFAEILSQVPSRPKCDMLLSWYFNSKFMVLGIIHPQKFGAEVRILVFESLCPQPLINR